MILKTSEFIFIVWLALSHTKHKYTSGSSFHLIEIWPPWSAIRDILLSSRTPWPLIHRDGSTMRKRNLRISVAGVSPLPVTRHHSTLCKTAWGHCTCGCGNGHVVARGNVSLACCTANFPGKVALLETLNGEYMFIILQSRQTCEHKASGALLTMSIRSVSNSVA